MYFTTVKKTQLPNLSINVQILPFERAVFKTHLWIDAAPLPESCSGRVVSYLAVAICHAAGEGWHWVAADTMPFVWGQCWVCLH